MPEFNHGDRVVVKPTVSEGYLSRTLRVLTEGRTGTVTDQECHNVWVRFDMRGGKTRSCCVFEEDIALETGTTKPLVGDEGHG